MVSILLLVSVIIVVCIFGGKLSSKAGVPTLFIFIVLGMLFGTDGIFKIPFENYNFAGQICSVALIFIMFYGGFGTRWSEAKPVAARAILLSLVAAVLREGQTVVPKGDTVLKDGEMVVLGAEGYKDRKHVFLYEITVDSNHK